ncbi:sensor histidine kinase, partial [Escherichia coli]|nr:sensor histidine kinase [Escherichia coli]
MQETGYQSDAPVPPPGHGWRVKLVVVLLILVAVAVVLITNRWMSERFTESTRSRAELRLALYSGNLLTELQRTSVVPLLLARDPALIGALG